MRQIQAVVLGEAWNPLLLAAHTTALTHGSCEVSVTRLRL